MHKFEIKYYQNILDKAFPWKKKCNWMCAKMHMFFLCTFNLVDLYLKRILC